MGKLKGKRVKPNRQPIEVFEDDGAQEISDDGEIPADDDDGDLDEEMEGGSGSGSTDDEARERESGAARSYQLGGTDASFQRGAATAAWKAPTTEELANIKAASELFKSNAFRFKLEALLPQVRPKTSTKQKIEPFLMSLHEHLRSLPSISPQQPFQAFKGLTKLRVRLLLAQPIPTEETKWKVLFEPPSEIQIVGSWPNQLTVIGRTERAFYVDLAVGMPSVLFQEKDYLDARFFHKRSYFLAIIAASLVKSSLDVDVEYEVPEGNVRRAALLVHPKPDGKYDFKRLACWIRIIPFISSDSPISLHRLSPTHCNLRDPSSGQTSASPTPRYNNDLLLCTTPSVHLLLLHLLCSEIAAFRDAVALLRVWANQRGYGPSRSAISGFDGSLSGAWWPFLIAYLIWGDDEISLIAEAATGGLPKRRKGRRTIGKNLSSYQLFRAVLDLLGTHDFVSDPVRVRTLSRGETLNYHLESQGFPIFVGPSSPFNFLSDIPPSSMQLLRHDARCTLQALDSPSISDGFEAVFMQDQCDLQQRFDSVIRIDLSKAAFANSPLDPATDVAAMIAKLDVVLRRGLGARVRQVALIRGIVTSLPVSQDRPRSEDSSHIVYIGLLLDPEQAVKLVEHGPPAEDTEGCESFRQFWGDKSELRRFNDGRITESVVWELTGKSSNERFQIPARVVCHTVERHLGVPAEDTTIIDAKYDGLVTVPEDITARYSTLAPSTAPEAIQRMALTAFDELVKDIKAMESLPLSLVNAVPADESLRYTSCLPPIPLVSKALHSLPDCCKYIPTMEVISQFEQSTRWPDDLEAIQKVKIALLDAIAQGLLAKGAPHAVVVWDGNNQPLEDHVALETILTSGFAFRIRVQHDRERTLMERIISDKRGKAEYERKRAQAALERHTRRFISLPAHHAAILSLQRRCPSYSHAVRLFSRWISAHWLSPYILIEATELICAEVYLNPGAQEPPCSGQTGFARTIAFLANWDFREYPIALPLYSVEGSGRVGPSGEVLAKMQELFAGHISVDPGLSHGAWTLATEQDLSGHMWTQNVTLLVASRVREIAKATMSYMNAGMAAGSLNTKGMFVHPTADYDFIIHLRPSVVTRYTQNLFADPSVWGAGKKYANIGSNLSASVYGDTIRLDFDPVDLFIKELQRIYDDSAVWFYDRYGGTSIGGVWNPMLAPERPFRVLLGFSSQPSSEGPVNKKFNVTLNKAAILAEVERLGSGLILKITQRVMK